MKIVSVLLARGGSKEIPMKNIMDLNGHPLIYYTIRASQQSNIQETWISTDNEKIASICKEFGAKILIRPRELATDISLSEDALLHFASKVDFDILVFIQPTSPLLKHIYINVGIDQMLNNNYDSIFSAYKEEWCAKWSKNDNVMLPIGRSIEERLMRQKASPIFVENGAFYITTREALLKSKNRYSGKIGMVRMPYALSFQLDTLDDLSIIEKLMT